MSFTITRRTLVVSGGLAVWAVAGASTLSACSGGGAVSSSGNTIATKDVPVGSAYIQPKGDYLVIQPAAGQYRAFSRTCPHAGCQVNRVEGDQIVCPCHGSRYSVKDGSRVSGPTPRGLTEVPVRVEGNKLEVG